MQNTEIIPLFPLGVVLFPEMPLPLHIFEERYKLMINECLSNNSAFGVVYYNGKKFFHTGCTAKIVKVKKQYNDGRMDILTKGEKRFNIRDTLDIKPYIQAHVQYFDDESLSNTEDLEELIDEGIRLLNKIAGMSGQEKDISFIKELAPKEISFLLAASDGFTLEEQQKLLEIHSVSERLEKGVKSLREIVKRLKLTIEIENIVRGNGHLPGKFSFDS